MSQARVKKSFDCIAHKRKSQNEIYEAIKDMSPQEQIEYFRKRAESGPLSEWWKSVKENQ